MSTPAVAQSSTEDTPRAKPWLVFFHSPRCGQCRRVEGFLAQVLQHRRNHHTFRMFRVDKARRPDLTKRFGITAVPTIALVDNRRVIALLQRPRGCRDIEVFLRDWLR